MERRLYEAAMEGSVASLLSLLQDDPLALDRFIVGCHTETPLHVAAMLGHAEFVIEILQRKPELAAEIDVRQSSALHLAAAKGYLDIVKKLLTVNPEMCLVRDKEGRTPLHVAAVKGRVAVLTELVGARPQAVRVLTDHGDTVLHACLRHNQLETLKVLVQTLGEYELLNCKDADGSTILHLAVANKQTEGLKFLITSTPIDINALNANGFTALDICLAQNRGELKDMEIAEALKQAGAVHAKESPLSMHELEGIRTVSSSSLHMENTIQRRRRNAWKKKKPPGSRQQDWLERKRSALMVVASLIATMAFQAGLNPPGGAWQDASEANSTSPHTAGFSIMADNHPIQYGRFLALNTIGFLASLSIILLLISGLPLKHKFFVWILMVAMWVAITCAASAYAIAVAVLTPSHEQGTVYEVLGWGIAGWTVLMALLLLGHTIRLLIKVMRGLNRLLMVRRRQPAAPMDHMNYSRA